MSRTRALAPPGALPDTPLGPGGRPLRGWRAVPTILAVGALAASALVLLSDRAPGILRRLSERIDARVARTGQLGSDIRLPESDFEVHVLMWGVAALLVGLAMWSWGSLLFAAVSLLVLSLGLEALQPELTTGRSLQRSDVVGNLVGLAAGLSVVIVFALGWRGAQALWRAGAWTR